MIYLLPFIVLNSIFYLLTAFLHWDILFIANMGDWDGGERLLFLLSCVLFNVFAVGSCDIISWSRRNK